MMYVCLTHFAVEAFGRPALVRAESEDEATRIYGMVAPTCDAPTIVIPFPECPVQTTTYPLDDNSRPAFYAWFDRWLKAVRDGYKTGIERVADGLLEDDLS